MFILGIDTSGKSGGVTLAEGDARSFRVLGSAPISGGTFSAQLVPTIAGLLERHGLSAKNIDGFAVVSGPGSFTGLRVGLSAVKGLAEILHKPIAAVSLLEALAVATERDGLLASALDAGRSEVFFGLYEISGLRAKMIRETLLSQMQFVEQLQWADIHAVATSDLSIADLARKDNKSQVEVTERPESSLIAKIGLRKLLDGETVGVDALDANYIRRSDAEIFFKGNR